MECNGCGNKEAYKIRSYWNKETQKFQDLCDRCGNLPCSGVPDVYFREPYFDEHLACEKHPEGRFVESKQHKAQILRELGLKEAGDRFGGARTAFDPRIQDPMRTR